MKFWNWGPTTIWHNMTCGQNCFQKSLHPSIQYMLKRMNVTFNLLVIQILTFHWSVQWDFPSSLLKELNYFKFSLNNSNLIWLPGHLPFAANFWTQCARTQSESVCAYTHLDFWAKLQNCFTFQTQCKAVCKWFGKALIYNGQKAG